MVDSVAKHLEKIDDKIDMLVELNHKQDINMTTMSAILDKNTDSLILHEKRTTVSEDRQGIVEDTLSAHLLNFNKIVSFGKGAAWLLSFLVATVFGLIKLGVIQP